MCEARDSAGSRRPSASREPHGGPLVPLAGGTCVALAPRSLLVFPVAPDPTAREECYRLLFDGAFDAILVFECDTLAVVDANHSATTLFGRTRDELTGVSVSDLLVSPRDAAAWTRHEETHIASQRMRRVDGSGFLAEVNCKRLELAGRNMHAAFLRDITKRTEFDEAYAVAEMKFAAAFASSGDAINVTRVEDGVYVEVNEGFTRLTGYSAEEVVGQGASELELWADPADRVRMVEALKADGFVDGLEAGFCGRDGTVGVCSVSARLIHIGGEPHILSVTRDISDQKRTAEELEQSNARLGRMVRDMTTTLGRVVETRDPYTHGHQERVARVSKALAAEMKLPDDEIEAVSMAALVHDVGKLSVPAEILNKPGALSEVEFGLIRVHSERGYAILADVDFPWPIAQIVLQHHERCDGSGYPRGLLGEEILLPARILAIADVVEAMASHRPYRPALGLEAAIDEIRDNSQKYDAEARAACLRLYESGELDFLREDPDILLGSKG